MRGLPSPCRHPKPTNRPLLTCPAALSNDINDNNDDTFDSGSHINIDVTDVINVIPQSTVPQFFLRHRGGPGSSPSQQRPVGRQPANGEADCRMRCWLLQSTRHWRSRNGLPFYLIFQQCFISKRTPTNDFKMNLRHCYN